jgi:indolepyruvate ferredoxin oxidoreductase
VPLSKVALLRAIELNGAGVEGNKRAFEIGRWAAHDPAAAHAALGPASEAAETLDAVIAKRVDFLTAYQNAAWARRYAEAVAAARAAERRVAPESEAYADAVARSLFKLMAYKDEYEVARLHAETLEQAVAERFDGVTKIEFHLAPPLLARKGPDGRPAKTTYGPGMLRALGVVKRFKALRGTPLDPFGWTAERRMERRMIADYRAEIARLNDRLSSDTLETAVEIARLPQSVRGFGHVKQSAAEAAAARRAALLALLHAPSLQRHAAE